MATFRKLTREVEALLASGDWLARLPELDAIPGEKLVGPLFSLLLHRRPEVGWRAVIAFGRVVPRLAAERMEVARVVMRRMLWMLNEESGNIAWRVPEALGEILANHAGLADEYSRVLTSYIRDTECDGNFLELCELRRGAYYGVARLAQARPDLAAPAWPDLVAGLFDPDAEIRGLAALALRRVQAAGLAPTTDLSADVALEALAHDHAPVRLWSGCEFADTRVSELAARTAAPAC